MRFRVGGLHMIELEQETFQSFLYKATKLVKGEETRQLISWTEQIEDVDLLSVFSAAKKTGKDRTYWTNGKRDYTFVGLGRLVTLTAGKDRYRELQEKWQELLANSLVHNRYHVPGTGLVATGGMSFDPKRKRTPLWEKYPTSELTVPKWFFVKRDENYYMTINMFIDSQVDVETIGRDVNDFKELLLKQEKQPSLPQKILSKSEIDPERWKRSVASAIQAIQQRKAKKIVLAREMRVQLNKEADLTRVLRRLAEGQPTSYVFAY